MKTRMMALSALAMFGIASTVNAAPPVQERFSAFIGGQFIGSCGDFAVLSDYYLDIDYKLFFDREGNAVRELLVLHTDGSSKYYNSADPTRFVEGAPSEVQIARWDLGGNVGTFMGPAFRINLPGQGVIFHQAGRLVVDFDTGEVLFEAGPQDWLNGNLDKLCTALR
jgi:hypothetical protein